MIKFNRPQSLDGALLIEQLKAAGVKVKPDSYGITAPFIDGAGDLFLDIDAKDQAKAAEVIANHSAAISLA
jgi:hypothetical protein